MEAVKFPIFITTGVLIVYIMATSLGMPYPIAFSLFMLTNGLTIWMVIRVLKDGRPSEYTFEEKWYDDSPIQHD